MAKPHRCPRRRNVNARHPDVLAARRREGARIRSEKDIRWGGRRIAEAALPKDLVNHQVAA
ncbi:MAG: hypothetical protein QOI83_3316 [Streptomycetaceae bacterium]|nr:hypothetical protein [Streptomycetaceae bacterium]